MSDVFVSSTFFLSYSGDSQIAVGLPISATVWPILICEIWHADASGPFSGLTVKISNFWKSNMAAAAILKITKIAISQQRIDRSSRNLAWWCKIGLLSVHTVEKNWISKIQQGVILKTVKSLYLRNHWPILMKLDRLMQYQSPYSIGRYKIQNIKLNMVDVSHRP